MNIRLINWQHWHRKIKVDEPDGYQNILSRAQKQLSGYSDSAKLDADILLLHVLSCCRQLSQSGQPFNSAYLRTRPDENLTSAEYHLFLDLLQQRISGKPIAYITGYQPFWTLNLRVNEQTLVPRPETELLVEQALKIIPVNSEWDILDLGTGSGAIALALAAERPQCRLWAVDKSVSAIQTARLNALENHIDNIYFICSDWFSALKGQRFQVIVANPPYIDKEDPNVEKNVRLHEPAQALFAENRGLADLQQIISESKSHLAAGGWLLLEHGFNQHIALKHSFDNRAYHSLQQIKDHNNHYRVSLAKI